MDAHLLNELVLDLVLDFVLGITFGLLELVLDLVLENHQLGHFGRAEHFLEMALFEKQQNARTWKLARPPARARQRDVRLRLGISLN